MVALTHTLKHLMVSHVSVSSVIGSEMQSVRRFPMNQFFVRQLPAPMLPSLAPRLPSLAPRPPSLDPRIPSLLKSCSNIGYVSCRFHVILSKQKSHKWGVNEQWNEIVIPVHVVFYMRTVVLWQMSEKVNKRHASGMNEQWKQVCNICLHYVLYALYLYCDRWWEIL